MNALKIVNPELLTMSADQIRALEPYTWLLCTAALATVLAVFKNKAMKWALFFVCTIGILGAVYQTGGLLGSDRLPLFGGMMISDSFSAFFNLLFLGAALLSIFSSIRYLDEQNLQHPEYYVLILFSALGMMLMTAAQDLISMFISLEIMSLSVYVLVGFRRSDRRGNEAAMKYFILGAAASAFVLYGTALLYGASGTMNISEILAYASKDGVRLMPMFHVGAWLLIIGFMFKVASVPFHMWMPDVYEGAPTPITGFMTTGIKAASFAIFMRIFISVGYGKDIGVALHGHLHSVIWIIAALTMFIPNVIALTQTNIKRMLAYSSIAHTGYLLIGILTASASDAGYAPMVMYLVSYVVMNLGAFGILSSISGKGDTGLSLQDLAGFSKTNPWLAFAMAVFLFSMAGIPPTAGFAAKYYLLYSAVQAGETRIVILAVLCSAISVYYYLRVLVFMYMKDPIESTQPARPITPAWTALAVAMMVGMTLQLGVLPSKMVALTKKVVASL